jgi:hypothetical protein
LKGRNQERQKRGFAHLATMKKGRFTVPMLTTRTYLLACAQRLTARHDDMVVFLNQPVDVQAIEAEIHEVNVRLEALGKRCQEASDELNKLKSL